MENLIKNKVKMKQSTVWKVSKVLSMVADIEKVLNKGEQLLLLGSGYTPILEKAMALHSSNLAWKIPWTEKPGRLQSMGSLKFRHD